MYRVESVWESKRLAEKQWAQVSIRTFGDAGSWPQLPYNPPTGICTHKNIHTHTHMHISVFPSLSVRGLRRPSKTGKDWLEACRVPLPATGNPGQIKTAQASQPALFPACSACVLLGHLKKPLEEPSATRWIRKEVILQWCERGLGGQGPKCMCMCVNWN